MLIRDVDIQNRHLNHIQPVFPAMDSIEQNEHDSPASVEQNEHDAPASVNADELLAQKLHENRSNAQLRNIIATLQSKQFEIISADIGENFAVQGCPGSGKTQCLIHRLFFLRGNLYKEWDKVLLITPTQMFRDYSAPLMRRYQLTGISNASLASFYYDLLNHYDNRFKNRQYLVELSEEYLPDSYLQQIYSEQQIDCLKREIQRAIRNHIDEAAQLLNMETSEITEYTAVQAEMMASKLADAIKEYTQQESILQKNTDFILKRDILQRTEKEISAIEKRITSSEDNRQKIKQQREMLTSFKSILENAEIELQQWDDEIEKHEEELHDHIQQLAELTQNATSQSEKIRYAFQYAEAIREFFDFQRPNGTQYSEYYGFRKILEEAFDEAEANIKRLCGSLSPASWEKRIAAKEEEYKKQNEADLEKLLALNEQAEECKQWLEQHGNLVNQRAQHRAEMERVRYYLNRIESAIFEQEVWKAMTPLKESCGIQALHIEELGEGRHKETRVLYKSDLLFYLEIYTLLHPDHAVPPYKMICIDEGQDFHRADYQMLRKLYPQASFNIFGDVRQALHQECGVKEWQTDTLVNKIYTLNVNYRNNAAIVDFCNRQFHCNMGFVGKIQSESSPVICMKAAGLITALSDECPLIVRDRLMFQNFCSQTGTDPKEFDYLDTRTNTKSSCRYICYSVFAAKGLEFTEVAVYADCMDDNQQLVACTRAMNKLYYYRSSKIIEEDA